jgi:uncharacterized short protein YbdD (DUF466 family)
MSLSTKQSEQRYLQRITARIIARIAQRMSSAWALAVQTARLIVGVPDYETYLTHMRRTHPDNTPMTREEFFGERMQARYGRGASRCC